MSSFFVLPNVDIYRESSVKIAVVYTVKMERNIFQIICFKVLKSVRLRCILSTFKHVINQNKVL